jgi:hypothetical protein
MLSTHWLLSEPVNAPSKGEGQIPVAGLSALLDLAELRRIGLLYDRVAHG